MTLANQEAKPQQATHTPGPWTDAVTRANARLIAAAPDHYAAAQRALDYLAMPHVEYAAKYALTPDDQNQKSVVIAMLRAAIAKTEGRAE